MSDVETQGGDVRRAIAQYVRSHETAMRDDLVEHVATVEGVPSDRVESQIDLAEKEGLLYLVNGEVRVP